MFLFHNTGLYNLPGPVPYPADNTGKYAHTGDLEDVVLDLSWDEVHFIVVT